MEKGALISDGSNSKWTMSDSYYEQFCLVRDSISFADFAPPLDREFQQIYIDLLQESQDSNKSRESIIHDAYMRMSGGLAES